MNELHSHERNGLLNPNNDLEISATTDSEESTKKIDDWKVSLICGSCACAVVFIVNLGVTIWSSVRREDGQDDTNTSRRIIYEGPCSNTKNMNRIIHLVINVCGSVLLSASNYGMQCLSTPTRADVDKAHAQKKWVDIGIPSFRNLSKVSAWRVVLWWLLVLSSLPLHLLFNSVVYSSLAAYSYGTYTTDKTLEKLKRQPRHLSSYEYVKADLKSMMEKNQLDNLTALQCIKRYGVTFQTEGVDVILVEESKSEPKRAYEINSTLSGNVRRELCIMSDYDWICGGFECGDPCYFQLPHIKAQSDDWRPFGSRVEYCLSQPAPERCRLNFDISIAVIILAVNLAKATILAFIVFRPPKEPMFILGDAIQSFMARPDENSHGSCLASARIVRDGLFTRPTIMHTQPKRRGVAVTKTRWFFSLAMYGVAFTVSCVLLGWGLQQIYGRHDLKSLWDLGFGTANETTLIRGQAWFSGETQTENQNIFPNVLVSNLPQLIFSLLYFQYNSLYTAMAAAKEWSDFGCKRRPLRVSSSPRGQQRSRYFLQLPYRYSISLVLVSILVHWMLSQCIFIVIVDKYQEKETGFEVRGTAVTCGYSPIAIICVVITSGLMAAAIIITACRRLPTGMPVASSCSLAIAAACHQPDGGVLDPEASLLPLQWGVMCIETEGSVRKLTDHCGFSHDPVQQPEDGQLYY